MTSITWGDVGATWGDFDWTWSGLIVGVVEEGCPDPPTPVTADPFTASITAPTWIGDVAILVEIETFSLPFDATISVYDSRTEICPPDGNPNPLSEILVALPAGVVFAWDGAGDRAVFYEKAEKRTRGALRYITPSGDRLIYPRVSGPCRDACVVVDAAGVDTDGAAIAVSAVLRET